MTSRATHWASSLIGLPWENGGQGPYAFDCWGFVRHIYQTQRGENLPIVAVDANQPLATRHAFAKESAAAAGWVRVDPAERNDFDVVLLTQARHPDHVGLWIGGRMLHCVRGAGVIYQSDAALRVSGWTIVAAYRREAA